MDWKENKFGLLSIVFGIIPLILILIPSRQGIGFVYYFIVPIVIAFFPFIALILALFALAKKEKSKIFPIIGIGTFLFFMVLLLTINYY